MKNFPLSVFRFPLSALLVLLFASCEKVVEFDIDDTQRQVVVNALPMTDSTFFVNITYSRFFLDNQAFAPVTDATVTLSANGTPVAFAGRNEGNYNFTYTVAAGDSLELSVDIPGRPTITAATRALAMPSVTSLTALIDTLQPITAGEIAFQLDDQQGLANHYLIYIAERDSGSRWNWWEERWDTIDTVRNAYFNCYNREVTDPTVNSESGFMDYFTRLLFSDDNIDGQSYEMLLSIPMFKDTAEHPILRQYTLVVESLSPEAFTYITQVAASQGAESYFAEPAQIYSNINGALGIFAAIARREFPITFTYKEADELQTLQRKPRKP